MLSTEACSMSAQPAHTHTHTDRLKDWGIERDAVLCNVRQAVFERFLWPCPATCLPNNANKISGDPLCVFAAHGSRRVVRSSYLRASKRLVGAFCCLEAREEAWYLSVARGQRGHASRAFRFRQGRTEQAKADKATGLMYLLLSKRRCR